MKHEIETVYASIGMRPWAERLIRKGYEEDEWANVSERVFTKTIIRNDQKFSRMVALQMKGDIKFETKKI